MLDTSSDTGVNNGQLVASRDGQLPVCHWSTFLGQYFKNIPNIKNFHYFRFSRVNQALSTAETVCHLWNKFFFLLRNGIAITPFSVLPQKINPEGLSEEC